MTDFKHCDEFIRDKSQPKCLRKFLLYNRIPAVWKITRWKKSWGTPELYAKYKKKFVRVVMASRFGDVGITSNLQASHGYEWRIPVEDLTDFTDVKPGSRK